LSAELIINAPFSHIGVAHAHMKQSYAQRPVPKAGVASKLMSAIC
jgi:hypothetical protein